MKSLENLYSLVKSNPYSPDLYKSIGDYFMYERKIDQKAIAAYRLASEFKKSQSLIDKKPTYTPNYSEAMERCESQRLSGEVSENNIENLPTNQKFQTCRYSLPHLGVEELFDALNELKVNYVILRWFEDLPSLDNIKDLDFLVADEDLVKLNAVFQPQPARGSIRCDVYSVTGIPGSNYECLPYYEARLAQEILNNATYYKSRYRVPDLKRHLLSLAYPYHGLFHKAGSIGMPVYSKLDEQETIPGNHDYVFVLGKLARELGIDFEPTLAGLYKLLLKYDWIPSIDLVRKLSNQRPLLRGLYPPAKPHDLQKGELAVFLIREWADKNAWTENIIHWIAATGFDIKLAFRLTPEQKKRVASRIRGGSWHGGSVYVSGGLPTVMVIAYDHSPILASPQAKQMHPYLSNQRVLSTKYKIRNTINRTLPRSFQVNSIHSSDDGLEAYQYVSVAGGQSLVEYINEAIKRSYPGNLVDEA